MGATPLNVMGLLHLRVISFSITAVLTEGHKEFFSSVYNECAEWLRKCILSLA